LDREVQCARRHLHHRRRRTAPGRMAGHRTGCAALARRYNRAPFLKALKRKRSDRMSAKRPALKSGKGKAANRPAAARKPAARKPAEHAKAAAHARKPVTQAKKAPTHHTPAAAAPAATLRRP